MRVSISLSLAGVLVALPAFPQSRRQPAVSNAGSAQVVTCDSTRTDKERIEAAIEAAGPGGKVVIPANCAGAYSNHGMVNIEDLRVKTNASRDNNNIRYWRREDNSPPTKGDASMLLNPWQAPALRLDLLTQSGGVTGAHNGLFIGMPGVNGRSFATTTQVITASKKEQTVAVSDSSLFEVQDSATVDMNTATAESVTVTAIPDGKHIRTVFTQNHPKGSRILVAGKNDKIGIASMVYDAPGNENSIFAQNLNVIAYSPRPLEIVGNEIDVTNSSKAAPGAFDGAGTPWIAGEAIVVDGEGNASAGVAVMTNGTARFLNGIQVEAAVNNGVVVGQGPSGAAKVGISVQGAAEYGLVIGSNQPPATNPLLGPVDPSVAAILLTARGPEASADSNKLRFQDRIASGEHTVDVYASNGSLRFSRDGKWQGASIGPDGSVTARSVSVSAGLAPDAGGLKHKRFVALGGSCPTAPKVGAACTSGSLSWNTPFADANYTVTCTLSAATGQPHIVSYGSKRAGGFVLTISAETAERANSGADCIAIHD